jgi:hypothetical protein
MGIADEQIRTSHTALLPFDLFMRRVFSHAWSACPVAPWDRYSRLPFHRRLSWIDAILNASMILGGMGPVSELHTAAGKLFASFYALFSGSVFLVVAGIVIAPVAHRFLHRLHLDGPGE